MRRHRPALRRAGEDFLGGLLLFVCLATPFLVYLAYVLET